MARCGCRPGAGHCSIRTVSPSLKAGTILRTGRTRHRVSDATVLAILRGLLVLRGQRLLYSVLDVEQIGAVDETMMGFTVKLTRAPSVAIKSGEKSGASTVIELPALLALASGKRAGWLKENAERKPAPGVARQIAGAEDLAALEAALASLVDRDATPATVPAGTAVLQPTPERRRTGQPLYPGDKGPKLRKGLRRARGGVIRHWACSGGPSMPGLLIRRDLSAEELRRLARREADGRVGRRLLGFANALDGMSRATAARAAGMDRQTLRDWVIRYNQGGVAALSDAWGWAPVRFEKRRGSRQHCVRSCWPEPIRRCMACRPGGWSISAGSCESGLASATPRAGWHKLLHALDLSWQTPRPQHPDSDAAGQAAFKKSSGRCSTRIAAEQPAAERLEVWFLDEARVGLKGRMTRRWFLRGQRPRMVKDLRYRSAYIFGAVCPERDTGVALVLPEVSTTGMNLLWQEIASQVPQRRHAVVLIDNAGWHVTDKIEVPANLTLVNLPPYSPELNAIERVWAVSARPLPVGLPAHGRCRHR